MPLPSDDPALQDNIGGTPVRTYRKKKKKFDPKTPELSEEIVPRDGNTGTDDESAPTTKSSPQKTFKLAQYRDIQALLNKECVSLPSLMSRDANSVLQVILDLMSSCGTWPQWVEATYFSPDPSNSQ